MKKIRLTTKAVNILKGLLLFLLMGIIIIDSTDIVRKWLDVENPIGSNILIVDGWITPYYYDSIVTIFNRGNYDKMLITGNSFSESLTLYQNGTIIIRPDSSIVKGAFENLKMQFYGSQASEIYPTITISINNKVVVETTIKRTRWIDINCPIYVRDSILIRYNNDGVSRYRDRNLTLRRIIINGNEIIPRSKYVSYKTRTVYMPAFARSYADEMAGNFSRMGISSEKIVALPTKNADGGSRTIASSRRATEWLHLNHYANANLVTLNYHSRRSKLCYTKIDPNLNLGVITLQDNSPWRWYKSKLRTVKELTGIAGLKIIPASWLR